ncbi:hypothetical protein LNP74_19560 [Klebsiella pneumoniae subsp. pneumoniae]|nr:hypothetical protein [Klebsiella pneumoniae subsp. pneumoniae]
MDQIHKRSTSTDGGGKNVNDMDDQRDLVTRMFNAMAGLNGVASSSVFSSAVGGLRNLMTSGNARVPACSPPPAISHHVRANAQALGFDRNGMRLSANTLRNLFNGDAKRANAELWPAG